MVPATPTNKPKYFQISFIESIFIPTVLAIEKAIQASRLIDTNTPIPILPGRPARTAFAIATCVITDNIFELSVSSLL